MAATSKRTAAEWCRRARELQRERKLDDAIRSYARALLLEPNHRSSMIGLGTTFLEMGRSGDAARVLGRAARLYPGDPEVATARAAMAAGDENPAPSPVSGRASSGRSLTAAGPAEADPEAAESPHRGSSKRSSAGTDRRSFVNPRHSVTADRARAHSRARVVGLAGFPAVVATYVVIGLRTHFSAGLAAAGLVAFVLAAGVSLFFGGYRAEAFRGAMQGQAWGLVLVLLAGLASVVIALTRATQASAW